jgi:hypothetical protein
VGAGIEYRIEAWKNWLLIVFWPPAYVVCIAIQADILKEPNTGGAGLEILPAIGCLLSGCLLTCYWFATLFGREIITVDSNQLVIKHDIVPGIGLRRRFDVDHIRDLSRQGPFGSPRVFTMQFYSKQCSKGTICFDYKGRTIRLAPKLTEKEARQLTRKLLEYLPNTAVGQ